MTRITIEKLPPVQNEEQKRHLIRYVNFINSRPERDLKQKRFHTHHIYPRHLATKNNVYNYDGDWNLVELTPREHFIAHLILWKCGYSGMTHAFNMMINFGNGKISGRLYEKFMLDFSKLQSEKQKGKSPGNKGKKASIETRRKQSIAKMGKPGNRKGYKLSNEEKQRISNINKDKRKITNGNVVKWLLKDDIMPDGFSYSKNIVNIVPKYRFRYVFNNNYLVSFKKCKFKTVHDRWITNGKENRMISFDNGIPFNWKIGKTIFNKSFCINNGKINKRWKSDNIPDGWKIGMFVKVKKIFITNGKDNIKILENEKIPTGWWRGLTKTITEKGRRGLINSNKGKTYITDGSVTKQWTNNKEIPIGWHIGRAEKGNIICITNGIQNKRININDKIPDGWIEGLTKKTSNRHIKQNICWLL